MKNILARLKKTSVIGAHIIPFFMMAYSSYYFYNANKLDTSIFAAVAALWIVIAFANHLEAMAYKDMVSYMKSAIDGYVDKIRVEAEAYLKRQEQTEKMQEKPSSKGSQEAK